MTALKETWNREDDMRHNYKLSVQRLERKEFCWITWHNLSHLFSWHSPVVSLSTTETCQIIRYLFSSLNEAFVIGCIWLKCPSYPWSIVWMTRNTKDKCTFLLPSFDWMKVSMAESHLWHGQWGVERTEPQRSHPEIPQVMPGVSPLTPWDYISVGKAS